MEIPEGVLQPVKVRAQVWGSLTLMVAKLIAEARRVKSHGVGDESHDVVKWPGFEWERHLKTSMRMKVGPSGAVNTGRPGLSRWTGLPADSERRGQPRTRRAARTTRRTHAPNGGALVGESEQTYLAQRTFYGQPFAHRFSGERSIEFKGIDDLVILEIVSQSLAARFQVPQKRL